MRAMYNVASLIVVCWDFVDYILENVVNICVRCEKLVILHRSVE